MSLPPTHLRRELGLASATLLVVGGTIGSGIFFSPSVVAGALPDARSVLLAWVVGAVVSLAGALTFAELGAMMPDAGGEYVFIRRAFGGLPSFLYGWMTLLSIGSGIVAAVSLGFAGYLARFVDLAPVGGNAGAAVATIAVFTALNYVGVKPGVVAQNVLSAVKIGALVALVLAGLVLWGSVGAPVPPLTPADAPTPLVGWSTALVAVLFTMGGWHQVTMVAGEIRDPGRTVPRSLTLGVLIVAACYLGVNAVYLRTLGRAGVAASDAVGADAATRLGGSTGAMLFGAAAIVSMLGAVHVVLLAHPRVLFAMARDGLFFEAAGRVHPRWGTPHVAIATMGAAAVALVLLAGGEIGALMSGVIFANWVFFGLGATSVFVLRRSMPDAERPYRVWGYPVVPAVCLTFAAFGVGGSIVAAPRTSLLGAALLALGAAVYAVAARRAAAIPRTAD